MDTWKPSTSQKPTSINWELFVVCQEETAEPLISPEYSKRKDVGKRYHSLAKNLVKFDEVGKLPCQ